MYSMYSTWDMIVISQSLAPKAGSFCWIDEVALLSKTDVRNSFQFRIEDLS